jgi:cytochrome c oxidase assembly factor CtaG
MTPDSTGIAVENAIALAFVATWLLVNGWATWVVWRDPHTEKRQKTFQLAVLWLVPIFGAIFIFALHRKPEAPSGTYRQSLDLPWDDSPISRHVGRAIDRSADD